MKAILLVLFLSGCTVNILGETEVIQHFGAGADRTVNTTDQQLESELEVSGL